MACLNLLHLVQGQRHPVHQRTEHRDSLSLLDQRDLEPVGTMLAVLKRQIYQSLRFTNVHVEEFRSFDAHKLGLAFCGNGFGQQRLAHSRRSVQQNAQTLVQASGKERSMLDRKLHSFFDELLDLFQSTHVAPFHLGDLGDAAMRAWPTLKRCQDLFNIVDSNLVPYRMMSKRYRLKKADCSGLHDRSCSRQRRGHEERVREAAL